MSQEKHKDGIKFDKGKERFDLLPVLPLMEVAQVYTMGAEKYEDRNWEKGMKWSRIFAAMLRHAFKYWAGEVRDKENGQHHLASVVFNAFALMEYERTYPELDDRWPVSKPLAESSAGDTSSNVQLHDVSVVSQVTCPETVLITSEAFVSEQTVLTSGSGSETVTVKYEYPTE